MQTSANEEEINAAELKSEIVLQEFYARGGSIKLLADIAAKQSRLLICVCGPAVQSQRFPRGEANLLVFNTRRWLVFRLLVCFGGVLPTFG